jgi:hypothetical protein
MRRSRIVVLYVHPLFGQGIGQILRGEEDLDVVCLSVGDGVHEELERLRPKAIVIEAAEDSMSWECLRDLAPATVIRIGLGENTMDIYERHQLVSAGLDNLIDAIHSGLHRRSS